MSRGQSGRQLAGKALVELERFAAAAFLPDTPIQLVIRY
jgi:hypothetical protein